jgi:hypothetical protein
VRFIEDDWESPTLGADFRQDKFRQPSGSFRTLVSDFGGALTPAWGQQVMVSHAASIQNTARVASILQ